MVLKLTIGWYNQLKRRMESTSSGSITKRENTIHIQVTPIGWPVILNCKSPFIQTLEAHLCLILSCCIISVCSFVIQCEILCKQSCLDCWRYQIQANRAYQKRFKASKFNLLAGSSALCSQWSVAHVGCGQKDGQPYWLSPQLWSQLTPPMTWRSWPRCWASLRER